MPFVNYNQLLIDIIGFIEEPKVYYAFCGGIAGVGIGKLGFYFFREIYNRHVSNDLSINSKNLESRVD